MAGRTTGVGGERPPVLAGQHAPAERRPGDEARAERLDGRHHVALDLSLEQRVLHLHRGELGVTVRPELRGGVARLPCRVVRQADVPRPPARECLAHRRDGLLERGVRIWRLDEEEVHVIGAEPLERGVERAEQPAPRRVDDTPGRRRADPALGAQDDLVAGDDRAEQGADDLLARTGRIGRGCVDERPSGLAEVLELLRRVLRVRVQSPRHRAEPEHRDVQTRSTHAALFHGRQRTCRACPGL